MATKVGQELVEFSFNQAKTNLGNGSYGFDPKNLDLFTKTVETYERELKRVFGSLVTTVSQIDQATGQAIRKVYIPKEYEQEALGVRRAVDLQEFGKQGMNSQKAKNLLYQAQDSAHFLETTREIKGTKAQQFAKESVIDIGGKIIHTPNTANKDMMTTYIPITDTQLNNMSKKDVATYVRDVTPASNSASRAEQAERTRKEREAQLEADAKRQQAHLRDLKKQNDKRQRDQERQQRQTIKEEAQAEKERVQSRKQTLGRLTKIVGILTVLTDVARRILTSVLNFGSEFSKITTKANTLNIGAQDVRNFNYLDKALGLDAGTQIQGQEDLRAKFGNTAKLDTEALKWLAMVMGDKVVDEVKSGLGGENPAYLMEQILDSFYQRQQQGVDQYGNQVGQEKARRALVTLLESVSPSIARTFERMVEEQTSGLHAGEITSYRQLQRFYLPSTGGLDTLDWDVLKTFGDEVNELKAKFYNLGELIKTDVAGALSDFVGKLNNLHIGETQEEAFLKDLDDLTRLKNYEEGYKDIRLASTDNLLNFFGQYGLAGMAIEDVINYAGYSLDGMEGEEREKVKNARSAFTALYNDPEKYNDILNYFASAEMIDLINDEYGKHNPNSDPNKYGENGLRKRKENVEAKYMPLLGYLNMNELAFTSSLFTRDIQDGNLRFADVVSSKQQYFTQGAEEFFSLAKALGGKSVYGKAFADILAEYNKANGTSFKDTFILGGKGKTGLFDKLQAGTANQNELRILYDLFTFGTMYTDLDVDTRQLTQSLAKYLPDEYGLTTGEWAKINQAVGDIKVPARYKNNQFYTDIQQGSSAGKIDIVMHILDSAGKEVKKITKEVAGTLDKNFVYEDIVNEANSNLAK